MTWSVTAGEVISSTPSTAGAISSSRRSRAHRLLTLRLDSPLALVSMLAHAAQQPSRKTFWIARHPNDGDTLLSQVLDNSHRTHGLTSPAMLRKKRLTSQCHPSRPEVSSQGIGHFLIRSSTAPAINGNPTVASSSTSANRPPSSIGTNLPQETASL